jgi:hypothetical protein
VESGHANNLAVYRLSDLAKRGRAGRRVAA